jgi:uncharacterized BrkB/YihY/UPF0761 family membrane protein
MSDNGYIQEQYNVLRYSNEQFDKNVLFIASGALGISFAFIEKIIPDLTHAVNKHLLIGSWCCFAVVISITLVVHFISILANRWAITHDDSEKNYSRIACFWNLTIRCINVFMILGLLSGIILLIQFVNLNI